MIFDRIFLNCKHTVIFSLLLFVCSCKSIPKKATLANKPGCTTSVEYFTHNDAKTIISAHRGGMHYAGYPENAIETFDYVLSHTPAWIECDIELTKDSVLILMHDNTLDRTTTGSGKVKEKNWADIKKLKLKDNGGTKTKYRVPTLQHVLEWARGRTILTLDVKRGVPFERVVDMVKKTGAEDHVIIITYNAEAAKKVHKLHRNLMLSVSIRNTREFEQHLNTDIPKDRFVAFTGTHEPTIDHIENVSSHGIPCILGTLGNLDKKAMAKGDHIYANYVQQGVRILATDRPIEAAKAVEGL